MVVPTRVAASTLISTPEAIVALANEHRPLRFCPEGRIRRWGFAPAAGTRTSSGCAKNSSEPRLLERARSGDHCAFGELSERCRAPLLSIARRILRDESDAQDSVQDSLLNAFVSLGRFDGRSTFLTWATRITINCCLMRLRSRRKHYERRVDADVTEEEYKEIGCAALNPEQATTRDEEKRLLHLAIAALPETLRTVVEIKELQERSMKEAASLLGISLTAAKSRLFRAKGLLKRRLSSEWVRAISVRRTAAQDRAFAIRSSLPSDCDRARSDYGQERNGKSPGAIAGSHLPGSSRFARPVLSA